MNIGKTIKEAEYLPLEIPVPKRKTDTPKEPVKIPERKKEPIPA